MFGIGGQELVLLMVIGLLVLGPERLPRIANQVGGWLGQARRMTRVMKRQLEEELDFNEKPTIKPPPSSREPSTKADTETKPEVDADSDTDSAIETISAEEPEYTLPRDDDDYSPAHGEEEAGTGVSDDIYDDEADLAASEAERAAVEEAALNPIENDVDVAEAVEEEVKEKEAS
ncbi:MAG: Sec-independent protein translocase protein TatB [Woeseiaceae bacterium]